MIGRAGWIILGVMATSAATGSVMVLPMIGAHKQALAEQPRVKSLVNDVVTGEIKILAQRGTYVLIEFGANDLGIALNSESHAAIVNYAVEARRTSDGRFRVQAWPRPVALEHGHAAAVSYYVDLSAGGKIIDRGWVGQDDSTE